MPYKSTGSAGKSASGASMSKYDVEVEARLKALESKGDPVVGGAAFDQLTQLEAKLSSVTAADAVSLNARVAALEETLDGIIDLLNTVPQVVDHTPCNTGVAGRVPATVTGGTTSSALG